MKRGCDCLFSKDGLFSCPLNVVSRVSRLHHCYQSAFPSVQNASTSDAQTSSSRTLMHKKAMFSLSPLLERAARSHDAGVSRVRGSIA